MFIICFVDLFAFNYVTDPLSICNTMRESKFYYVTLVLHITNESKEVSQIIVTIFQILKLQLKNVTKMNYHTLFQIFDQVL